MFATGLAIFLGLLFIFIKLKRRTLLRLLRHDLLIDLAVTVLVLYLHWGSFAGVMAATVAGLMCSLATSGAKHLFGYLHGQVYMPGVFHVRY